MAISTATNGYRADAANSVYLAGKSRYGSGSFLFFDAQASTDPLDDSSCRGLFVDSSNRLSFWNGTTTARLTGGGTGTTPTWEEIYAVDATFALTAAWTLSQGGAFPILTLTKSNVGAGAVIDIDNSGTGYDIDGTSSTWYVTKAGAAVLTAVTMLDDEPITLGTSSDATIQWVGASSHLDIAGATNFDGDMTIEAAHAVTIAGAGGATKFTITAGDAVMSDGSLSITDADNAETVTVINNTATTIGAAASAGVVQVESTSLTTGAAVNVQLTEGTLNGGWYYSAWDATVSARVFSVGEDGLTTITGAGGSNMLVVTAGDALLSDGSLTIVDADNAATVSITNNTVTTANAIVDIASTSITTGAVVRINANNTGHDGEILELINAGDATSTGTGLSITMPDITTGAAKGLSIVMAAATTTAVGATINMASLTTGTGLLVTSAGTMVTTGELVSLVGNSATTCTGLLRISGTGLTDGWVAELTGGGANATATGGVLNLQMGAATAGTAINITTSGVYTGTTGLIDINANSGTTGTIVDITNTGRTTGDVIKITTNTTGTGNYFHCYDGAATDFKVSRYGATTIAGNALGTAALTVSAGDAVLTSGHAVFSAGSIIGTPQTLSGAGAVDVIHLVTEIVTTGVDALTLADGTNGQLKICTMITDGGEGTLTPTSPLGFATIKFNDVGDSCILVFVNSGWQILSNNGCTVA